MTAGRYGVVVVRGRSMLPTLREGDRLLVRYGGTPLPGRLAVVALPPQPDGTLRPLAVKRLLRPEPTADGRAGWWVERDSRMEGVDSWLVGAVPEPDVRAVVLARLWPRPGRAATRPRG